VPQCYLDLASIYDMLGVTSRADPLDSNAVEWETAPFVTWTLLYLPYVVIGSNAKLHKV
jgi:hypothetical protein